MGQEIELSACYRLNGALAHRDAIGETVGCDVLASDLCRDLADIQGGDIRSKHAGGDSQDS